MSSSSFHRPQKHYDPPEDAADRINSIYKSITGLTSVSEAPLNIPEMKFRILNACFQEFQYSVPNSLLSTMHTLGKKIWIFYIVWILAEGWIECELSCVFRWCSGILQDSCWEKSSTWCTEDHEITRKCPHSDRVPSLPSR